MGRQPLVAFRGTRFKPLDENSLPVVPLGPESTVMSGTFHGSRWRILAQKMSDGPCLHPEWDGGVWNANSETDGFQGECPLLFPLAGVGAGADLWLTPKGTTVQFIRGYAEARASRIVVELPDGTRLEASIGTVGGDLVKDYGLAPSFSGTSGQPFEVFVLPLQSPVRTAQVFAYDSSGRQIASDRFDCMSIGECA